MNYTLGTIRAINSDNTLVCLCIGVPLNILLAWIVLNKTPKEAKKANTQILLQTCVCNLILLALAWLVQPILLVFDGVPIILANGIAGQLAHPIDILLTVIWLYVLLFCFTFGLCVQFVYRFLALCRKSDHRMAVTYVGFLSIAVILQSIQLASFFWISGSAGANVNIDTFLEDYAKMDNNNMATNMVFYSENKTAALAMLLIPAIMIYLAIVICAMKIWSFMCKNVSMKPRELRFNRQLNINMFIQASLSMFVYLVVFAVVVYATMVSHDWSICALMLSGIVFNWLPTVLPLVTLWTIVRYRRALLVRIGCAQCISSDYEETTMPQNLLHIHHNHHWHPLPPIGGIIMADHRDQRRPSVFTVDSQCSTHRGSVELQIHRLINNNHRRISTPKVSPTSHVHFAWPERVQKQQKMPKMPLALLKRL